MRKIIIFFCMLLNMVAYGMNLELFSKVEPQMRDPYARIIAKHFIPLIELCIDSAIDQVWDQEKDAMSACIDDVIILVNRMNPNNYDLMEKQQAALNELKGDKGKVYFAADVKLFRRIYAIHQANQVQASLSAEQTK